MFGLFRKKEKTEEGVQRTKQAWFSQVTSLFNRPSLDEELWDELEELLISADVGFNTTEKLLERVKDRVRRERISDASQARTVLQEEMVALLVSADSAELPSLRLLEGEKDVPSPLVVLVVGVNGVGKTTSIAKLAKLFKDQGKKVVLAAADTFRAAAIDQLRLWGERIGVDVIAHQPGADPGAVVYDAIQALSSRHADVLIVDTAGRLHTKYNLMEELKKVKRVISRLDPSAPHEVLLVLDATTGQNGLSQVRHFADAVGVSGILLAKLDGTAKGGIILPIADELKVPITYIGTGEKPDDLAPFDAREFVEALFA
ncbi:MAG TPA: signal recognition particle-docking protein FtsY [Dehalococcoidia bacterium]|nr:signal recognition particle-docking protein FtsY [Dehalococcoidia bacterium]